MYYQLTEEEFHRLEGVMCQLRFICETGNYHRKDHVQQIDMRGLMAFAGAQEEAISQTIDAVTERYEQQRGSERLDAFDIVNLVDMLAGDYSDMAPDAAARIMRHLMNEARNNSLYLQAVESFSAFLVPAPSPPVERPSKASKPARAKAQASVPKAAPRKRNQLVEGAAA